MRTEFQDVGCEVLAERSEKIHDCDPGMVRDLLRRQGWVAFNGFAVTVPEFEAFSAQFGVCANTRTVHYPPGGEALGFHAEDAYNPYRPDTLWFLCVFEGSDGGAPTGVVDGVRLLAELEDPWREMCYRNELRFDRRWDASLWQRAVGTGAREELEAAFRQIPRLEYSFLPNDDVHVSYRAPIVTRTADGADSFSNTMLQAITEPPFYGMNFADGSPVPPELPELVQRKALAAEQHLHWHRGRVAVIDNIRMMHRRAEYVGKDRDLRARHCENFYGTEFPPADTPVRAWAKSLIQGDEGYPTAVGPLLSRS